MTFVKPVESGRDAITIAVSEVGKRVTPATTPIRNIDASIQEIRCGDCESTTDALLLMSKTALLGHLLTMEVQGPTPEQVERIARREIGPHLEDPQLKAVNKRSSNE